MKTESPEKAPGGGNASNPLDEVRRRLQIEAEQVAEVEAEQQVVIDYSEENSLFSRRNRTRFLFLGVTVLLIGIGVWIYALYREYNPRYERPGNPRESEQYDQALRDYQSRIQAERLKEQESKQQFDAELQRRILQSAPADATPTPSAGEAR
jgi:hypothetical protein